MTQYHHFLKTGSGSNRIDLEFHDGLAELNITTRWMGAGLKKYKLQCEHRRISESFGLLVVQQVEAAIGEDASFERVTLDDEEVLLPLIIEYIQVPKTPVYVHEQSQLFVMRPLGYASWNEHFELVLLVHDFEWQAESSPLKEICGVIDKQKLALHSSG